MFFDFLLINGFFRFEILNIFRLDFFEKISHLKKFLLILSPLNLYYSMLNVVNNDLHDSKIQLQPTRLF